MLWEGEGCDVGGERDVLYSLLTTTECRCILPQRVAAPWCLLCTLHPPPLPAPSWGGGCRSTAGPQQPRRSALPDASTPLLAPASSSRRIDGAPGKQGVGHNCISPHLPASTSSARVAGRAVRMVETHPTSLLTASVPFSCAAPSWARVVRDGAIARLPPSVK